jgi:DNA-binding SARP family transcriptional activator
MIEPDVVASFPYGIVTVDRDGAVVSANAAALRLAGDDLRDSCALLGCHRPGPLAGVCLTELAAQRGAPLPEIRLDLPPGSPAEAAWVTAAPLPPDGALVVVELRSAEAHDRRRRTVPHWTSSARLRISTLGPTQVESAEGPIGGAWLHQRPGQLLKFLLAERHRVVSREEIAETIWPGADPRILGSVRHFVHALRARLEPARADRSPSAFVASVHGGYTLDLEHVSVDADLFAVHVEEGLAAGHAGDVAGGRRRLEAALALYAGDFLADEPYADWAMDERDRLRRLAADALRALAAIAERQGDLEATAAHMSRLAELDPFDVDVHREVIALCLVRERRSEALRRYAALRARIMRTFGEDVGFALSDLGAQKSPGRAWAASRATSYSGLGRIPRTRVAAPKTTATR